MKRCLAAVVLLGSGTTQADGMFYGLLRARDVTPFGSLRLDMRLAHAVAIERGSFAWAPVVQR